MSDGGWKTGEASDSGPVARAQGWLDRVPGYQGYRAKEDRRDADRRVREQVALELGARAARVESVARTLANQRRLAEIAPVDELAKSLRHLIDRVRTASYGYGGLFSDRNVDEAALDQLAQFDASLLAGVAALDQSVSGLEEALTGGGDFSAAAATATAAVRLLHDRLDLRGQVIESGQAAPVASVTAVLDRDQAATPPPAFDLGYRDAIAILGDNFVVDARIDIATDADGVRFFRVDATEPERWLFVPRRPGGGFALLTKASTPAPSDLTVIGGVTYAPVNTGRGEGELASGERASGRRSVTYTLLSGTADADNRALLLDWDGERQLFVGSVVMALDVEIFGSGPG